VNEVKEIPIESIKVGAYDVRADEDDPEIDDLAASIRRIGVISPLHVVAVDEGFVVVAGHRRLRAARRVNLATLPCIVVCEKACGASEVSFAENLFRKDLTPVELASAINDYISELHGLVGDVAVMLHRSPDYVRRYLAILTWPSDVQKAVHEGWLSVSAAENLASVKDDAYRDFLLGHARQSGATARLTAAWLQAYQAMQPVSTAIQTEPLPPGERPQPLVPQAPCIVCSDIFRTDELSHVPCCASCIRHLRKVGDSLRR